MYLVSLYFAEDELLTQVLVEKYEDLSKAVSYLQEKVEVSGIDGDAWAINLLWEVKEYSIRAGNLLILSQTPNDFYTITVQRPEII